tara:strand:+ start:624 stop:1004 length:381 start_codon:yes stop_codon:yes gene_type:complete
MNIPENLLYTKEHEWIKIDSNSKTAYVGITDYAQSELGDIVFVELPNINDEFEENDVFGTIEAVKTLADLFLPIKGKIIEINDKVEDEPDLINSDPYNDGWLIKMDISDSSTENLLDSKNYKDLIS